MSSMCLCQTGMSRAETRWQTPAESDGAGMSTRSEYESEWEGVLAMGNVTMPWSSRGEYARRESDRRRTEWGRALIAAALVTVIAAGPVLAREQERSTQPGMPLQTGGMVWITVSAEFLDLDEEIALPPVAGVPVQPALQGSLAFSVASPLPNWSVRAEFEPTAGPDGPIAPSCVMIRSPETEGEFVSVAGGLTVVTGHGPAPVLDLWLELQARPEWTDAPGLYHGLLHLTPVASQEPHDSEIEHPGALRVVTGSGGMLSSAVGPRVTVPVVMTVAPLTVVLTSETEFNIDTGPGLGRYPVEPDLGVLVATNEEHWDLLLMGTPFVSDNGEIALERVEWSVLDAGGEPGIWTMVGDSNCLMSGEGERGVLSADFRMALEVIVTDVAGEYISELHLVGSPQ